MKKFFLILLCTFLLSACGNNQTISKDKESNNINNEYPERKDKKEKNIKEKNIITPDISFKVNKKYRDSISLKAVEVAIIFFHIIRILNGVMQNIVMEKCLIYIH